MKILCLFANEFPYGTLEPYLESEIRYYSIFDKVYIFSLQLRKEHAKSIRRVPDNIEVIPIFYAPRYVYFLYSIVAFFDKNFYKELSKILCSRERVFSKIITLLVYVSRAHYEYNKIKRHFRNNEGKDYVFYSYRFEYQPYVAILLKRWLKKEIKIVSRAHRYDLYECRRPNKYIPMRGTLLQCIDNVYPCSENGTRYLKKQYPLYGNKIISRYLGTNDFGVSKYHNKSSVFRIVTCSNAVPTKRLDLLVQALANIRDCNVIWTHFGDGYLLDYIKQMASQILPNNVSAIFMGNIKNEELMKLYFDNEYHLFVNVSSSEGIPVSIMEANSFGIPCLATDVGGTSELIENGKNGELIRENVDPIQLAKDIKRFYNMPEDKYLQYRIEARKIWGNRFNAEQNYSGFVHELMEKY